jgi:hypothetical protein
MNVFFGMGVPGANPNDPSFFLRLPHLWPMFVIPIVCFYSFLAVWVVRKVQEAMATERRGTRAGPSDGATNIAGPSGPTGMDERASERGEDASPFDLHFYPCIELTS